MITLTQAQIAKRTFDHCRAHENVADLSDKQVWVIGYMYAGWVTDHYGAVSERKLLEVMPEGMAEVMERFDLDREAWLAARP